MTTTKDVRDVYSWRDNYPYAGYPDETAAEDFDAWLAEVSRVAAENAWNEGARWGVLGLVPEELLKANNPYTFSKGTTT